MEDWKAQEATGLDSRLVQKANDSSPRQGRDAETVTDRGERGEKENGGCSVGWRDYTG